jgi:hypothetical protein
MYDPYNTLLLLVRLRCIRHGVRAEYSLRYPPPNARDPLAAHTSPLLRLGAPAPHDFRPIRLISGGPAVR